MAKIRTITYNPGEHAPAFPVLLTARNPEALSRTRVIAEARAVSPSVSWHRGDQESITVRFEDHLTGVRYCLELKANQFEHLGSWLQRCREDRARERARELERTRQVTP